MKRETLPIITEDNEYEYWIKYKETKSNIIREAFIIKYTALVKYIVRKVFMNISKQKQVDYDDLVSYGILGLIAAIEKYTPVRDIQFKTYAYIRIKGAIFDELRSIDFLPRSIYKDIKEIKHARDKLESKFLRDISPNEIARELGITIAQYNDTIRKYSYSLHSSLNSQINSDTENEGITLLDTVKSNNKTSPEYLLHKSYIKQNINNAIERLSELEKDIIELYYFQNIKNSEIGFIFGFTDNRISQIKSKALYKMRRFLRPYKHELLEHKDMPI